MRFLAGVAVGMVIGRPAWKVFEKSLPTVVNAKILETIYSLEDKLKAYATKMEAQIKEDGR